MEQREIPVIINPKAGRKSRFALWLEAILIQPPSLSEEGWWPGDRIGGEIVKAFHSEGLRAQPFITQTLGDIKKTVQDLVAQGERTIVVVGGDGTINEAVHGIAGTQTSLGIIPMGTANTLAIELGIPLAVQAAARVIREGQVRTIDVGKAGNYYFAMGAGLSYDAHVIKNVRSDSKRSIGSLAYIAQGLLESLTYPFPRLRVCSEDSPLFHSEGYLVIIANARFYGGHFKAAPRALLDDGLLDVIVMKNRRFWNLVQYVATMRYRDITKLSDVEYF
ncbi:MAG TPA: YegS/Rv2252/BmrU family lipid kinase, partial [Candidatus Omnitrophota bacterium]|nr:YegS/Rv2252/BmrU family lipid kinase [Candidatus Omnitrophota bacterium]